MCPASTRLFFSFCHLAPPLQEQRGPASWGRENHVFQYAVVSASLLLMSGVALVAPLAADQQEGKNHGIFKTVGFTSLAISGEQPSQQSPSANQSGEGKQHNKQTNKN